jgi:hypothetical protein
MREMGISVVVIYCRDFKCSHHIAISVDRWPDQVRLLDIEMQFTCAASASAARTCGRIY